MTSEVLTSTAFDNDSTPGNGIAGEDDQAASAVSVQAADLSLTNLADRTSARVGDNVTYTIVLSNAGPTNATAITVSAAVPTGMTLVSSAPSVGTYVGSTWTVDNLAIGSTATLVLVARVDTNGTKALTAQVTAAGQADPDSTPNNNVVAEDDQATASVDVSSANLSLTMTASSTTPNVNDNVTFTLNVRNSGPNNATGVTVRNLLPAGLNFVSSSQGAAYNAGTGIWTIGSLASGANATLQIVATPTTGGAFINTAEVQTADQQDANSTPGNGVATEDDQASVTINAQLIDLSLTKTVNNANPDRGSTITLTTTLTNAGPSTATGITVRDAVPSGFTYQSGSASVGTYTNSNGIWTIPSLAAGATATLTMTLIVNTSNTTTFTAEVTAANQSDADSTPNNGAPAEDDQASVQVTVPTADLSLTLAASSNKPNVGENVTFTITVANSGPSTAPGVIVSSVLPAGFTFISSTPSQGNYVSTTGRWTVGTIGVDGTATLQVVARLDNATAKTVNAEVIASDRFDPDSTVGNNIATEDDQASVQITPQRIDLSLAMTANPTRANVGQNVSFTLTMVNAGPDTATGIVVSDAIPQGMTFVSASPSAGTYNAANGTWTVPSLGTGSTATLILVATYDQPTQITNVAEISAVDQFDVDSTPGNSATNEDDRASVQITPALADLSLTQTVSNATPNFGQSVSFTLTLVNGGPDAATGVTVLDLLPAELAFVSSSPSLGTYDAVTGVWNVGTLASAGRATLTITATPTSIGPKTNTAQVRSADQFDPDSTPGNSLATEDDQASIIVTPQQIDLALAATIDRAAPNIGENVTYRITLTNAGPSTATGVRVRDLLPTGTSFVSATASSGSYVSSTGIWTPAALAANATATLSIVARVTAPGTVVNTAEVIAADQPDADSVPGNGAANEDDIASVSYATPVADLSLTQTVDIPAPNKDQAVTFTITITNSGPDDASGIVVNDRLPTSFSFVDSSSTLGNYQATAGTWTIPALANGQSATLTITGVAKTAGTKTNVAEIVRAAQGDPDSTPGNGLAGEDDIASASVTPALVDLSVRGTIDNLNPVVGDIVTITFNVNNAGPLAATGVQLQTQLPIGVTLIENTASFGAYDPATGVWSIDRLTVGQTETLTLTLSVDMPSIKRANIQVTDLDQFDNDSVPANDSVTEDDFASVVINAPRVLSLRLFLTP